MNLPRIIKAAVVVTFFNSWILWDLGAFVLIAVVVWRALGKAQ